MLFPPGWEARLHGRQDACRHFSDSLQEQIIFDDIKSRVLAHPAFCFSHLID